MAANTIDSLYDELNRAKKDHANNMSRIYSEARNIRQPIQPIQPIQPKVNPSILGKVATLFRSKKPKIEQNKAYNNASKEYIEQNKAYNNASKEYIAKLNALGTTMDKKSEEHGIKIKNIEQRIADEEKKMALEKKKIANAEMNAKINPQNMSSGQKGGKTRRKNRRKNRRTRRL